MKISILSAGNASGVLLVERTWLEHLSVRRHSGNGATQRKIEMLRIRSG